MRSGTTLSPRKTPDPQHQSPWDHNQAQLSQRAQPHKVSTSLIPPAPQDDHKPHPYPKPRLLNSEICYFYSHSPCKPPNQSLPHKVPWPSSAPLHEDEEAA